MSKIRYKRMGAFFLFWRFQGLLSMGRLAIGERTEIDFRPFGWFVGVSLDQYSLGVGFGPFVLRLWTFSNG